MPAGIFQDTSKYPWCISYIQQEHILHFLRITGGYI